MNFGATTMNLSATPFSMSTPPLYPNLYMSHSLPSTNASPSMSYNALTSPPTSSISLQTDSLTANSPWEDTSFPPALSAACRCTTRPQEHCPSRQGHGSRTRSTMSYLFYSASFERQGEHIETYCMSSR